MIRVFPRKTRATPVDAQAYYGGPELFTERDEVHISVAFTWDIPHAMRLADQWSKIGKVNLGGPAFERPGGDFVPGQYLKPGYVITSRGCPNRCPHCAVWRRESAGLKELPIKNGWNILDDNLLACSERHVRDVFVMLQKQKRRVEFTGGLEAARLQNWHIDLLAALRQKPTVFLAYDIEAAWEPLRYAADRLFISGFTPSSHRVRCYVLIGQPSDTIQLAEKRLQAVLRLGLTPMAMLWREPSTGKTSPEWRVFQRRWARPAIIHAK
jgi:hypothetical protein